mmetsp:Transcript_61334/g.168436  ORF Transcript_61334/g.168436 Transcript_61334/m.168436 type:complete len:215 (+) Transcript_61334:1072-1716(+)
MTMRRSRRSRRCDQFRALRSGIPSSRQSPLTSSHSTCPSMGAPYARCATRLPPSTPTTKHICSSCGRAGSAPSFKRSRSPCRSRAHSATDLWSASSKVHSTGSRSTRPTPHGAAASSRCAVTTHSSAWRSRSRSGRCGCCSSTRSTAGAGYRRCCSTRCSCASCRPREAHSCVSTCHTACLLSRHARCTSATGTGDWASTWRGRTRRSSEASNT